MSVLTPEQIKAALEAGIISPAQAQAMQPGGSSINEVSINEVSTTTGLNDDSAAIGNEENLRFIRGFSDIFIAIGVGLLALGIWALAAITGGGLSFLVAAAIMAVMAEYFGRKKRVHLPTLITALAFLVFVQKGLGVVLAGLGWAEPLTVALITAGAMGLFYLRIRLPFCIALIAVSSLYLFYTVLFTMAPDFARARLGWVLVLSGVVTLSAAIYYDMKDVHRTTRFSDNAFWLHLTAAPLIIHGLALEVIALKTTRLFEIIPVLQIGPADAAGLLIIIAVITFIGLALNRRALIVSSLGYAFLALGYLFNQTGIGLGTTLTLSLLVLGAAIVLLGVAWHGSRNLVLKILPNSPIFPPPFIQDYKG